MERLRCHFATDDDLRQTLSQIVELRDAHPTAEARTLIFASTGLGKAVRTTSKRSDVSQDVQEAASLIIRSTVSSQNTSRAVSTSVRAQEKIGSEGCGHLPHDEQFSVDSEGMELSECDEHADDVEPTVETESLPEDDVMQLESASACSDESMILAECKARSYELCPLSFQRGSKCSQQFGRGPAGG